VLLVLDDLGSHAKYHREIALQSGEVPGRESYPGDLFYQQARLLERGGRFGKALGSGSITLLPVLETNIEDISSLISTNLVSATDGHLFFSPLLHAEGYFPAVSAQESVTRVGRKTQSKLAKQLSIRTLALLAEYEHQRRYSQFGTQLSEETRATLSRGEILRVFLDQDPANVIPVATQVLLLSLVFTSFFDGKDAQFARTQRAKLIQGMAHDATADTDVVAVIESAQRGSISFEQFQKKLTGVLPYFSSLCKP
jgi:F-type H+-transporting ATPase subunit alpha